VTALRVHGHREESIQLANRAAEWQGKHLDGKAVADDFAGYSDQARSLYLAERWDEARSIFLELAAVDPADNDTKGFLGVIAARRGEREEAERISEELRHSRQPYRFGQDTYWCACIAALLGERERAVELLRASFAQGMDMAPLPLWDMDLEPLHGYKPYEDLMKPKG